MLHRGLRIVVPDRADAVVVVYRRTVGERVIDADGIPPGRRRFVDIIVEGSIISNLTLFGSVGTTGSQSYSPYQAKETYSFGDLMFPYPSGDVLGAQLMAIGNPDLGWSKTMQKSVSLEFGLWNSRLNATVSYYHNYTDEMLLGTNIQPSTGFSTLTP